ncbi:hypothetical protein [Deinococcus sp. Leaf326]|uniref:Imm32 family immunity protein n=1 Tax=Deinococcus sp. Leaf326 TaxID=1736338 RepID=UPI0006F2E17D|nr:hypothetical protein [Deinococcus sp. Leaf326]KQR25532.1 hypothetical protein ASF71_19210 [Deinococcus sp. Leaf326]
MDVRDSQGVVDLEANIDDSGEVILSLNKRALDNLIEQLQSISLAAVAGGHVHLDDEVGLEGNIRSLIILRREER